MRRLLALWEKEVLALSRDVLGLAVLFLMPAAFIVVMSLALSDVFKGGAALRTEFAVMAADPKLAERLVRALSGDGFRAAPAPADEAAARDGVRRGRPSLVLIVPRDFERALGAPLDGKSTPPGSRSLPIPACRRPSSSLSASAFSASHWACAWRRRCAGPESRPTRTPSI